MGFCTCSKMVGLKLGKWEYALGVKTFTITFHSPSVEYLQSDK